ncbi:MAG: hypothetical protein GY698_20770, partial [Actinomycetia bacterium]|nr:hypothetical protein [Actinomycetes bacterium]
VGAGAVFSAPTVISLAKTPAYAVGASAPIVIDDFSHDQIAQTQSSHPSFLFNTRYLEHQTTFSTNSLTMHDFANNGTNPAVTYGGEMFGDLVGCDQLVLQNVTSLVGSLLRVLFFGAGVNGTMVGVLSGTDIIFDLTTINPLVLTDPWSLGLHFNATHAQEKRLVAGGPLIAQ